MMRVALIATFSALYCLITVLVVSRLIQPLDDIILPALLISPDLSVILSAVSDILGTYIWLILPIILFSTRKAVNFLIGSMILINFTVSMALKLVFMFVVPRPRPYMVLTSIFDANSYPSGHTMRAFAGSTVFPLKINIFYIFTESVGVITALTRLLLGVHYFSDVLAGSFLGILIALVTNNRWVINFLNAASRYIIREE